MSLKWTPERRGAAAFLETDSGPFGLNSLFVTCDSLGYVTLACPADRPAFIRQLQPIQSPVRHQEGGPRQSSSKLDFTDLKTLQLVCSPF